MSMSSHPEAIAGILIVGIIYVILGGMKRK